MGKLLYIVDTPYQTFNAINLQHSKNMEQDKDNNSDIFIVNQFTGAAEVADRLRKSNIFDRVYLLRKLNRHADKTVLMQWIYMGIRLVFSSFVLKEQIDGVKPRDFKKVYSDIYASYFNPIVASMLKLNQEAKFYHMEDGIGSYFFDIMQDTMGWKYKLLSRLTHSGTELAKPDKYYLNNPDFFSGKFCYDIVGLPHIDNKVTDIANSVFGTSTDMENRPLIWLTDPMQDMIYGKNSEYEVSVLVKDLIKYKKYISIRLHPRESRPDIYKFFHMDKSKGVWELLIPQMDMDRMILMAFYSTAQFTPKIIYDKEPFLIFLDHIYRSEFVGDNLREKLVESYSDSERIMIPKSKSELYECIETALFRINWENNTDFSGISYECKQD
ncbi:MAG: hypothetical protein NC489_28005 [Ruminococcus flavefaciens]|nr:hypothetical protein [Ruminococcus flavefaciens]